MSRRSISIRGDSYLKLKEYCKKHGITMSAWLEEQAAKVLKDDNGNRSKEKPFSLKDVKKESVKKASNDPVRGGGTHML